ncbi:Quinoprotein glucose dehydrogenase [Pantoea agglomerans]|uniref:Quinoprotein glucose dehydrogenase n=1 Tax=Enterobacter agglomerans TaxID=549 RepID=A0A379AG78_ENTAG|nr:Quinoprotein glucose dehydrogenase [Pantoea agglomerans]
MRSNGVIRVRTTTSGDRDNPSQPSLVDINYQGKPQPAVILPTKTGKPVCAEPPDREPVYPVEQVKVSTDGIKGEQYAATQPVSSLNFIPQPLTEKSMWGHYAV